MRSAAEYLSQHDTYSFTANAPSTSITATTASKKGQQQQKEKAKQKQKQQQQKPKLTPEEEEKRNAEIREALEKKIQAFVASNEISMRFPNSLSSYERYAMLLQPHRKSLPSLFRWCSLTFVYVECWCMTSASNLD